MEGGQGGTTYTNIAIQRKKKRKANHSHEGG